MKQAYQDIFQTSPAPAARHALFALLAGLFIGLSLPARAEPSLKVMFGISRPPYVMEESQSGISVELAREIFTRMGEEIEPLFGANQRLVIALKHETVDVAVEVQPLIDDHFYSDRFIAYRNYVVSRRVDKIRFTHWEDLSGNSVCAWQNARSNLGTRFTEASRTFQDYREFALQKKQVRHWLKRGCQAIVIDDTLLKWWIEQLSGELTSVIDRDLVYAPFPGDNQLWWYVGFREEALRDRFDSHLQAIRQDGTYQRIRENFSEIY